MSFLACHHVTWCGWNEAGNHELDNTRHQVGTLFTELHELRPTILQQFKELNDKYSAIQRTTSELHRLLSGTKRKSPDHVTCEPMMTSSTTSTWAMDEQFNSMSHIITSPSTGGASEPALPAPARDRDFTMRRLSTIRRRIDGIGYKRSKSTVTAADSKNADTFHTSFLKRQNATENMTFVGDKRKAKSLTGGTWFIS